MKPPPFRYHDPRTVEEALDLLSDRENARLLAGGQSLMPMLNMRFVMPDHLVDLNRVDALAYIRDLGDALEVGTMTRQRELEFSEVVRRRCPLMHEALLQVGHRQTRNRGTIGGSLCHLDPSAELPIVAAAVDAIIHVAGRRSGTRRVPMAAFPAFYMTPAIEPDELVTAVTVPPWPEGHGYAFVEFARRHGDFAVVAAAALLDLGPDGIIRRASLTIGGVGSTPIRSERGEAALVGERPSDALFRAAAETCRAIDAMEDVHASSAYRKHLAVVLAGRALHQAATRANGSA